MNESRNTRDMATANKIYHILVLEDDEAHIELIRRGFQLASGTYRVTFAQTVQDARAVLVQDPPDLIIADWLLPDGKGIDILPRKDGLVTTPLVITTSHGNEQLAVDMLKSGAMDYVVKSEFTFRYLPRIAERVLKEWENITERKRMQEVLQETSTFLKNILDSIQDGISVLDTDCNIILVNKAMETWYAHEMPLVGKKCYEAYYGATKPCDPCPTRDTLKTGEPHHLIVPQGGAGGKIVGWQDLFVFPLLDQNTGKVKGAIEYVRNITEQKRTEEALRESEQFLDNIVEQIPDMIFVKDAEDLRFVRFNKAGEDLLGYSREELLGKNDYNFFPKTEADFFTGKDRDVLRMNQLTDIPEERIQTRNRGERILHTKKIPIVDDKGIPRYLLGISEDITERKRAEEQITIANRKLALMTDVTFQDIQNKVTALRGYVEIIKENVREHERIILLEKEEAILESVHRLIKNTKEYQQMGMDQLRWIPLEPRIRMQASLISGKPDFPLDVDLHGLEIYTDPLIDRVFYNLLDNTVKHGKTFTRVSFSCKETPDGLILICEDDGIGIPPRYKIHIFDRVVGGIGKFGLFFVREFLEMSGMSVRETGESGKGARFEISVPEGLYRFTGAQ